MIIINTQLVLSYSEANPSSQEIVQLSTWTSLVINLNKYTLLTSFDNDDDDNHDNNNNNLKVNV